MSQRSEMLITQTLTGNELMNNQIFGTSIQLASYIIINKTILCHICRFGNFIYVCSLFSSLCFVKFGGGGVKFL